MATRWPSVVWPEMALLRIALDGAPPPAPRFHLVASRALHGEPEHGGYPAPAPAPSPQPSLFIRSHPAPQMAHGAPALLPPAPRPSLPVVASHALDGHPAYAGYLPSTPLGCIRSPPASRALNGEPEDSGYAVHGLVLPPHRAAGTDTRPRFGSALHTFCGIRWVKSVSR